ncbi:hypothetical protein BDQ17DRAFT_1325755 [Cyathus striatus]|nr:hypothetical protein BDQ17DRAFT_1325755 [Cyathus striatus]
MLAPLEYRNHIKMEKNKGGRPADMFIDKHFTKKEHNPIPELVQKEANQYLISWGGGAVIEVSDSEPEVITEKEAHPHKKHKLDARNAVTIISSMQSFVDRALTQKEEDRENTYLINLPEYEFEDKQFLQYAKETNFIGFPSSFTHYVENWPYRHHIAEKWEWPRVHAEQLLRDIQAYFHMLQKWSASFPIWVEFRVSSDLIWQLIIWDHLECFVITNFYNHRLYEETVAEGKDPHCHHAHMHITGKGINTEHAGIITDDFTVPIPLQTGYEGANIDLNGVEAISMQELDAEFTALEQSRYTTANGDGFSAAVPVENVYNTSLIDIICRG